MVRSTTCDRSSLLEPGHLYANESLADIYLHRGDHANALKCYEVLNSSKAKARRLECLFFLGQEEDFRNEMRILASIESNNLEAAAISAYAADLRGWRDPYPFCPAPLNYIHLANLNARSWAAPELIEQCLEELGCLEAALGGEPK